MEKVVLGIVIENNKILAVKRKKQEGNLLWQFPGGKVEEGETEEAAVEREVYEESNIRCKAETKIGERIHQINLRTLCVWSCKYISGEIENNDSEIAEVSWMTKDEFFSSITSNIYTPVKEYILKNTY